MNDLWRPRKYASCIYIDGIAGDGRYNRNFSGAAAASFRPDQGRGAAGRLHSNLHQINAALIMYADDHADSLRAATNDYQVYFTYREDINSYLSRNGSSTNDSVFTCPADQFDCAKPLVEDFFTRAPHPAGASIS